MLGPKQLPACAASSFPGSDPTQRGKGAHWQWWNKACLFRVFGGICLRHLVRKPSPCAPQRHLPRKSTLAPFAILHSVPRINSDWPLQTPCDHPASRLWTHSLWTNFVRRTRCAACRSCTSRIPRCGLDADLGPKNARSEPPYSPTAI